jgi:YggT family protein
MPLLIPIIDLYSLVVLVTVILSWIRLDPRHPVATVVYALPEPVVGPIRRALPPLGGLDLSPMVVLLALQVLKGVLR